MAVQGGALTDGAYPLVTTVEYVAGIPITSLADPFVLEAVDNVAATISQRFPTPPSSFGILTDVDFGMSWAGVVGPHISSALSPEPIYLEPTTGQIWPRLA